MGGGAKQRSEAARAGGQDSPARTYGCAAGLVAGRRLRAEREGNRRHFQGAGIGGLRFKTTEYSECVDALLDELIEDRTYAHYGDVGFTRFSVALEMGLSDSDVIETGEDGYVILKATPEKLAENVANARAARARGERLYDLIVSGVFH